jgi:hypothetical protein
VEAVYADENVWLTQRMMAELYDVSIPAINQHLKRIFGDNELEESAVVKQHLTTAADGKGYQTKHYNLAAIIAVGYKVNSENAVQFRKWATGVIESLTIRGYAMDDKLLSRELSNHQVGPHFFATLRRIWMSFSPAGVRSPSWAWRIPISMG